MAPRLSYLRFLNFVHALDECENTPKMDFEAKKLLETISLRHEQKQCLTVTEAMRLGHIASPATIHRKLNQLLKQGMIETVFVGNNRRTKYLVPTQATHIYFEAVGRAMQQALK